MTARYLAVLAITAADDQQSAWSEVTAELMNAFARVGLDWSQVEVRPTSAGRDLLMPPEAIGRLPNMLMATRHLPALRFGLAAGMVHYDGRGWYGTALSTARRLAASAPAAESGSLSLLITEGVYRGLADSATCSYFRELTGQGWAFTATAKPGTGPGDRPTPTPDGKGDPAAEAEPTPKSAAELIADSVSATAHAVGTFIDRLPELLTPEHAPHDVLLWMYETLGLDAAELLSDEQGRRLLPQLMECYQWRGTAAGLIALIELRFGIRVTIADSATTTWSPVSTKSDPRPRASVTVRVNTERPLPGLEEVIRTSLPVTTDFQIQRR